MKPGTFTQLYIHIVFAVKYRECLLQKSQREELFKYTSGIIEKKQCKSIIVNGYTDHIHILTGLNPNVSISDLVRDIKRSTSLFINNEKNWYRGKFHWQDGYGAFSYAKSQLENVYNYILNQEEHHSKKSFKNEYLEILKKYDVEYDTRFLFDFFD
ncbi:MAG: IS200/IS605 family transposase [Bacteroidales bacterium]|jgi:putative transposase|nr:IS200/IS605 family transposase [Bacteroidales bacterium]